MLSQNQIEILRPQIARTKIVIGALIVGVVTFAVVAALFGGMDFDPNLSMLSMILFGISAIIAAQGLILPIVFGRLAAKQVFQSEQVPEQPQIKPAGSQPVEDARLIKLVRARTTSSLIGGAMLESAALINFCGHFIEHNAIHLVAGLFCIVLMLAVFPTENRVLGWIEDRINDARRQ